MYARTLNGVYNLSRCFSYKDKNGETYWATPRGACVYEREIIRKSQDLEVLFDLYVVVVIEKGLHKLHYPCEDWEDVEKVFENYIDPEEDYYELLGGIWTNKGITYVARCTSIESEIWERYIVGEGC